MANTLETIAEKLGAALLPFAEVFDQSDDNIAAFVEELGYILPSLPPSLKSLQGTSQDLIEALTDLTQARIEFSTDGGSDDSAVLTALARVVLHVTTLATDISSLHTSLGSELPPAF